MTVAAWWQRLSRPQQLLVGVGAPLAAGAAIVANVRDRTDPEPSPAGPVGQPGALDLLPTNGDLVADFGFVADRLRDDLTARVDAVEQTLGDSLFDALVDITKRQDTDADAIRQELEDVRRQAEEAAEQIALPVSAPPRSLPAPAPSRSLPPPSPGVITGGGVNPGGGGVTTGSFEGLPGITDQDLANMYAFYGGTVPTGPAEAIRLRAAGIASRAAN